MQTLLTIFYVLICFFLILVVLLQSGKGGGMGSAFGGTSQSVFGGAGAGNVLTRLTAIGAALFMVLSATMAYLSSSSEAALEQARQDIETREAARSGATGDTPLEAPEPAGMSAPSEGEDEAEAADEAPEGLGEAEGLGDPPPPEAENPPAAAPEPADDGLGDAPADDAPEER